MLRANAASVKQALMWELQPISTINEKEGKNENWVKNTVITIETEVSGD